MPRVWGSGGMRVPVSAATVSPGLRTCEDGVTGCFSTVTMLQAGAAPSLIHTLLLLSTCRRPTRGARHPLVICFPKAAMSERVSRTQEGSVRPR